MLVTFPKQFENGASVSLLLLPRLPSEPVVVVALGSSNGTRSSSVRGYHVPCHLSDIKARSVISALRIRWFCASQTHRVSIIRVHRRRVGRNHGSRLAACFNRLASFSDGLPAGDSSSRSMGQGRLRGRSPYDSRMAINVSHPGE